jgi:hypothetical protein
MAATRVWLFMVSAVTGVRAERASRAPTLTYLRAGGWSILCAGGNLKGLKILLVLWGFSLSVFE